ncbi:unnamed protein product [Symbiodinium sp. CCMP2456]|nr:unnamed protein product [Symbiodinium sp. CCMP2456]
MMSPIRSTSAGTPPAYTSDEGSLGSKLPHPTTLHLRRKFEPSLDGLTVNTVFAGIIWTSLPEEMLLASSPWYRTMALMPSNACTSASAAAFHFPRCCSPVGLATVSMEVNGLFTGTPILWTVLIAEFVDGDACVQCAQLCFDAGVRLIASLRLSLGGIVESFLRFDNGLPGCLTFPFSTVVLLSRQLDAWHIYSPAGQAVCSMAAGRRKPCTLHHIPNSPALRPTATIPLKTLVIPEEEMR